MHSRLLPILCQVLPRWSRPCHHLPERPLLARVACPRRGWFTWHRMRAQTLVRAMGNYLASAKSAGVEPSHTHYRSCLPPFSVLCPGATCCHTIFHCYTGTVPKGPAGHSGPSATFPCSIGYGSDPSSHVPLDGAARPAVDAGQPHTTPRNHGQSVAAAPPARPAGARLPTRKVGFSSEDQGQLEGDQAESSVADGQG